MSVMLGDQPRQEFETVDGAQLDTSLSGEAWGIVHARLCFLRSPRWACRLTPTRLPQPSTHGQRPRPREIGGVFG